MEFEVKDNQTLQKSIADFCRFLADFGISSDSIFDCRLVANELLGNVLRHAQSMARFIGEIEDGFVRLMVQQQTGAFIPPKTSTCSDVYEEGGRGLFLIDSVCEERITTNEGHILVRIKIR